MSLAGISGEGESQKQGEAGLGQEQDVLTVGTQGMAEVTSPSILSTHPHFLASSELVWAMW